MIFPIEPELITEQIAADASNRNVVALSKVVGYVENGFSTAPWYGQATGVGSTKPVYSGEDLVCVISDNGTAYRSELAVGPNVAGFMQRGYYMRRKGLIAFDMTLSESMFTLASDFTQYNTILQLFPVTANTSNIMGGPALELACRPNNTAWIRTRLQTGTGTGVIANYPGETFSLTPGRHQFSVWYDMDAGFVRAYVDGSKVAEVNVNWGYTDDNIYANNYKIGIYSPQVKAADARSEGIHPERTVIIHGTDYLSYSRTWNVGAAEKIADFSELEWNDDDGGVRDGDTINLTSTITGGLTILNPVSVTGASISATSSAISATSIAGININRLTLSSSAADAILLSSAAFSENITATISECFIDSATDDGIDVTGSYVRALNNTIEDVGDIAIRFLSQTAVAKSNFIRTVGTTIDGAIRALGSGGGDIDISFNLVDRTDTNDGYTIYFDVLSGNNVGSHNELIRQPVDAFRSNAVATDRAVFECNKVVGSGYGIWSTTTATGTHITSNVISSFNRHGVKADGPEMVCNQNTIEASVGQNGIRCEDAAATSCSFTNNIIVNPSQYGIRGFLGNVTTTTTNCIYNATFGATVYTTDTANITDDPILIDPTNGNLHIDTNSPCVRAGTKWWATQADQPQGQDGMRFPLSAAGKPDMGAYPVREDSGYARKAYALPIGVLEAGVDVVKARTI